MRWLRDCPGLFPGPGFAFLAGVSRPSPTGQLPAGRRQLVAGPAHLGHIPGPDPGGVLVAVGKVAVGVGEGEIAGGGPPIGAVSLARWRWI
jgi:hypothetical protein